MSYGLTCFNASGQLTLSSDGYLFGYIGKATLVSITAAGTDTSGSDQSYATYTITWGAPIICGVALEGLSTSSGSCVDWFTNSGSTWTIHVRHTNRATNSLGFLGQLSTADVHVWGLPVSVSGFGGALYDGSGNLTGDLTRRPLTFDRAIAMDASTTSVAMTGYTQPVVVGASNMQKTTTTPSGSNSINRNYRSLWNWDDIDGLLTRVFDVSHYELDADPVVESSHVWAANVLLLEGASLS